MQIKEPSAEDKEEIEPEDKEEIEPGVKKQMKLDKNNDMNDLD